jgi:hypothetical protein
VETHGTARVGAAEVLALARRCDLTLGPHDRTEAATRSRFGNFRAIQRERPEVREAALARTRRLMCVAVRACLVEGFEPIVEGLTLSDPNDRPVLAAAIRAGAQTIATRNHEDVPSDRLAPWRRTG